MIYLASISRREKLSSQTDEVTLERIGDEYRAEVLKRWLEWVPDAYATTKLDLIPSEAARLAARDFWARDDDARGLGLVGLSGQGKTRAALYALKREMLSLVPHLSDPPIYGEPVYYGQVESPTIALINCGAELSRMVRASGDFKDTTNARIKLSRLRAADFLILDDLGAAKLNDSTGEIVYDFVESRTSAGMPVLFTTNFSGAQLAARFADDVVGAAVVRRLKEFAEVIPC